jgi:hypothetical protein
MRSKPETNLNIGTGGIAPSPVRGPPYVNGMSYDNRIFVNFWKPLIWLNLWLW